MSLKICFLLIVGFCSSVRSSDKGEGLEPKVFKGRGNYVRWGRSVCPGGYEQFVYKGKAGGSFCSHPGGASNYLCLPEDAQMSKKEVTGKSARLYGAEYEFGDTFQDQDVPCVVCETERPNILMIPARTKCYDKWTVEYVGYLSAGYYGHNGASEYVCLDKDAETVAGGAADMNGKLFYLTKVECGILLCPPYSLTKAVPCVVCSK